MKSKLKKLEGTSRQFHIEIPKEKVEQVFNEVLLDIQKNAVIPGFRQGKAPIDMIRKRKRERVVEQREDTSVTSWVERMPSHDMSPAQKMEMAQLQQRIQQVLDTMKPKHRIVFCLREIDELSYEEIAETIGCAVGTVESRLHRARKIFQKKMKKQGIIH